MPSSFVSEPIAPVAGTFDAAAMSRGEPGLPRKFRWHRREFTVVQELERWREHGDCRNGSGERYVRKHGFRVRTDDGSIMRLYFQRSVGRGKILPRARWWLHSIELQGCAHTSSPAQ